MASTTQKLSASPTLWPFVLWWTLANTLTFGLVGAMFHNFPLAFTFPPNITRLGSFGLASGLVGGLAFGAVPALVIGLSQWLVVRRYLPISRWWILTSSAGVGVLHFINDGFENARDLSLAVAACGFLVGIWQWYLIRDQFKSSAWWILVTASSWLLGWLIGLSLLRSLGILYLSWRPGLDFQQHGWQGIVLGAINGLLTGIALVRLSQANRPEALQRQ